MNTLTDDQIENLFDGQLNTECTNRLFDVSYQNHPIEKFSSSIEHAFKLIAYAESKGFWCELKTPVKPKSQIGSYKVYHCTFIEQDEKKEDAIFDNWSTGLTMEVAICRSFLKWHRDYSDIYCKHETCCEHYFKE